MPASAQTKDIAGVWVPHVGEATSETQNMTTVISIWRTFKKIRIFTFSSQSSETVATPNFICMFVCLIVCLSACPAVMAYISATMSRILRKLSGSVGT